MRSKKSLQHLVVVITGASSGIGKAAARAFANEGANLVLAARRAHELERVAKECRERGVEALAVQTDTANDRDIEALAGFALEKFGHFDVWINNASVLMFGSLEQTPRSAYRRLIDVNFLGYVAGARAALQHFRERGRGVLINNASLFSTVPTGYTNAYTAAKHAVAGFTDALRQELVPAKDIHIIKILPAGVDTPILQHAANYTGRRIRPFYPLISPERVAKTMVACARRPRREAMVGAVGRVQAALYRLTPALNEWIYGQVAAGVLKRADPLRVTDGILFEPSSEGTETEGGLRARSRRWRLAGMGLVGLSALGALRCLARRTS